MSRIDKIKREVCEHYGITLSDMLGRGRTCDLTLPRFIAMAVAQDLVAGLSYPAIGRAFGGRDHTTAIHAIRRVNEWRSDAEFDADYHDLRERISARINPTFQHRGNAIFRTCRKGAAQ